MPETAWQIFSAGACVALGKLRLAKWYSVVTVNPAHKADCHSAHAFSGEARTSLVLAISTTMLDRLDVMGHN